MDEVDPVLTETLQRLARGQVDSESLLELLAAVGANGRTALQAVEALREHAAELQPAWGWLVDWVRDWPSPPQAAEHFRSWLVETEPLGLAREALGTLPNVAPAGSGLSEALTQALDRFRASVEARRDHARFAGLAEQRIKELGRAVPPWSWLRAGDVLGFIVESEQGAKEASELWLDDQLHSADAIALKTEVTNDATFRSAYADALRQRLVRVELTQWTVAWSLDVARAETDLEFMAPALHVTVPHIGASITLWQNEAGAYFRGPSGVIELLTGDVGRHKYPIPQLGDFETEIAKHVPSQAQDVWHGLASLQRVAEDGFADEAKSKERLSLRAAEVVDAFVDSFEAGVLREALREGYDAFERGTETSEDLDCLVRYALEARLELSLAFKSLAALGRAVEETSVRQAVADEALREYSSAVLLIEARDYRELVEGVPLDRTAWWATRRVLDERVPEGVVEGALMGGATDSKAAKVIPLHRPAQPLFTRDVALAAADPVLVPTTVCPWLSDSAAVGPLIGQVPLLLFRASMGQGVVAQLSISLGEPASDTTVWEQADVLGEIARTAIRDAYWAAGALCSIKCPPRSLSEHRIQLVLPADAQVDVIDGDSVVDGKSVGVAAALAFASLWAHTPIPRDLVATAGVNPVGVVSGVGRVEEKATRLRRIAASKVRLVVASENVEVASRVPVDAVGVGTLQEALSSAGIDLERAQLARPSVSSCEARLSELIRSVRTGNPVGHYARAWQDTADELAWLVQVLSKSPTSSNVVDARCWAAIAYLHAGVPGAVSWILSEVDRTTVERVDSRTLVDVVAVERGIDHREPIAHWLETLARDIEELAKADARSPALGYALGTTGRGHMHSGDAEAAVPWLRRALKQHQARQPWEAARSRIYLSMALRLTGDLNAAYEQLLAANEDLTTHTREYSPEYEGACRMYLEYERARVLLALERFQEAERAASGAEEWARWTNWPLLGILRTRAWTLRMLGRHVEADQDVARMEGIDIGDWIKQPLVEEAKGYPVDGGEVY